MKFRLINNNFNLKMMKSPIYKLNRFIVQAINLSIIVLLVSCSTMYVPSNSSAPLHEEKGEKQIEVALSSIGAHVAGNYAFSDNYALMLNGHLSYKNFTGFYDIWDATGTDFSNNFQEFAHRYGELGIGRYGIIKTRMKLEVFTGYGYGVAFEDEKLLSGTNVNYDTDYHLGFLQINFGYRSDFISAGGGLRFAFSNFNLRYPVDYDEPIEYTTLDYNNFHIEPFAFVKVGKGKIKFVYKFNLSLVYNYNIPDDLNLKYGINSGSMVHTPINIHLGINYNF